MKQFCLKEMCSNLYKEIKKSIVPAFIGGIGIGLVIMIGMLAMQQTSEQYKSLDNMIKGFCFDKIGEYNLSQYYQINGCEIVNCSNGNYTPCMNIEE